MPHECQFTVWLGAVPSFGHLEQFYGFCRFGMSFASYAAMSKQANKATHTRQAARSDWWEAGYLAGTHRARRSAKRAAKRAERRLGRALTREAAASV